MGACQYLDVCPFFAEEMPHMPTVSSMLKRHYCREYHADCARYKIAKALGCGAVPADLLPTHITRASRIIEAESEAS